MPHQPFSDPSARPNPRQLGPVRDVEGSAHFELFLVLSVTTIAVTRLYLLITGYPQIGGSSGLHVGHVLFGGLLMMAGLLTFMLYLGRRARWVAVILAGVGFGLFIDEVGKFVTQDNNYFFQPTAAIIYALLMLVYVFVTFLVGRRRFSDREHLVNALKLLQEAAADDLDEAEEQEARRLLDSVSDDAPLKGSIVQAFETIEGHPASLNPVTRLYLWIRRGVIGLTRTRSVERTGVLLFAVFTVVSLADPLIRVLSNLGDVTTSLLLYLGGAALTALAAVVATVLWQRHRETGSLQVFSVALTFQLLVVQLFHLLQTTFIGFVTVMVNVLLLGLWRSMLYRREHPEKAAEQDAARLRH